MPIVEFYCDKCDEYKEVIIITQKDKQEYEKDTVFCEKCGNIVKRVMSLTGKGKVK